MSPYDEDKSFLQEFFWAALDRHRERGHNEKFSYDEVMTVIRSSSVAFFFDFDALEEQIELGKRYFYHAGLTSRQFCWTIRKGNYCHDGEILIQYFGPNHTKRSHYILIFGTRIAQYYTIPQLIAALEEAIPFIQEQSRLYEQMEIEENNKKSKKK